MFKKIKETFFNKKFITFCIIGFLAYLIHQGIYSLYINVFHFYDDSYHLISTAIAFILASIFTYLANAKFTYNTNSSKKTVIQSIIVFILKFLLTEGITLGIMAIIKSNFTPQDTFYKIVDTMLPLILTCITLILQFLAFNVIFKKKDKQERYKKEQNKIVQ